MVPDTASPQIGAISRYVVLRELGSGAMGVVFAAYDPDLDRKVAIKVLRTGHRDGSDGAVRMRREAQAMARLSHPNVAQIYEVGEHGGRMYLAMEFIDGVTVRTWLERQPRRWRDVVRVYVEAGRGLAAAHAAGLVHRDFKPDNVMIDADGRPRVLDFGLSRAHAIGEAPTQEAGGETDTRVSGDGVLIGTPAYMSPEQLLHREADARSDQFGFCVSLYEGLYGQRPFVADTIGSLTEAVTSGRHVAAPRTHEVPAWVRAVIERGLARDPAGRWPDMHALLAALGRDPERVRRRWWATGLAMVGLIGAGYGVAVHQLAQAEQCSGAADELRGVWDDERRAAIASALRSTGVAYADGVATAIRVHLDRYRDDWIAAHTTDCEAHRRGHLSAQAFDRRMACLRARRDDFAATVEVLAQTTRATAARAADAAAGLPALAGCEDDVALAGASEAIDPALAVKLVAPNARLTRLRALNRGGRYAVALAESPPLLEEAERLGHPPLLAEVLLLTGKWQAQQFQATPARASLTRALHLGLAHKQDAIAAEALAIRIYVVSSLERRPADALVDEDLAWAVTQRAGQPPELAAGLHNTLGTAYDELGAQARSIAEYEKGLALISAHAPDDPLRWALTHNLATALVQFDQPERAGELAREALARLTALHDPCHPHASVLRMLLASLDRARGSSAAAVAGLETALGCLGDDYPGFTVEGLAELAETHRLAGDRPRAAATLERADELMRRSPEAATVGLEVDLVRADLHVDEGELAAARQVLEAGYARAAEAYGADHYQLTSVWTRLAALALRGGDLDRAQQHLDTATRLVRPVLPAAERGLYAATAARVLRARGGPAEEVNARIAEATRAYEAAGAAYAPRILELRAWLSAPPQPG